MARGKQFSVTFITLRVQTKLESSFVFLLLQVRERCEKEWSMFQSRAENAERDYYISKGIDTTNFSFKSNGIDPSNFVSH